MQRSQVEDPPVRSAVLQPAGGANEAQKKRPKLPAGGHPDFASLDDRLAAGVTLRDKVPRGEHAHWKKGADRADPIAMLKAGDPDRLPELVPIRYGRMLASPFTFYRGAAGIMAADLAGLPTTNVTVQSCGDCHLMNFGGFATPERNIIFDINDFDETLPAPWEWDVKRLAASFVLAGRSIGLSDAKARDAAVTSVRGYRERLAEFAAMDPLSIWYARTTLDDYCEGLPKALQAVLRKRVDKAASATGSDVEFPKLAEMVGGRVGIRDAPPLIFHPEISHTEAFQSELGGLFDDYRETLSEDRRELLDRYSLIDVAIKVVGIGSVGRRCWIALLMSASNDPLFLQFKEAVSSVLERYAGASAYPHHGQRVVMGQRLMQPATDVFLGWVTSGLNGKQFYVRQLRDAKIKPLVETMDRESLDLYAIRCGWTLARAHAKGGRPAIITGYLGGSDKFDEAIGDFSIAYADQTERDHAALKTAVRKGDIVVYRDV
jgi:uncharacterized protein (DUF2252 family)